MLYLKRWFNAKFNAPIPTSNSLERESILDSSLDFRCSEFARMGSDFSRYQEWPVDSWYEPAFAAEAVTSTVGSDSCATSQAA